MRSSFLKYFTVTFSCLRCYKQKEFMWAHCLNLCLGTNRYWKLLVLRALAQKGMNNFIKQRKISHCCGILTSFLFNDWLDATTYLLRRHVSYLIYSFHWILFKRKLSLFFSANLIIDPRLITRLKSRFSLYIFRILFPLLSHNSELFSLFVSQQ